MGRASSGGRSINKGTPLHRERTQAVSMVGGDLLGDVGECRRKGSMVVCQLSEVSEVVLLEFEHDVTDEIVGMPSSTTVA